jgi:hypothetical protein
MKGNRPVEDRTLDSVSQICINHPEFQPFLDSISQRKHNQSETTVDALLNDCKESLGGSGHNTQEARKLAIDFFRELERAAFGEIRVGRRGKPTRFIWKVPLLDLKEAICASSNGSHMANRPLNDPARVPETRNTITHSYVLRADLIVTVALPLDLSENEAERLSAFIKTLPIPTNKNTFG